MLPCPSPPQPSSAPAPVAEPSTAAPVAPAVGGQVGTDSAALAVSSGDATLSSGGGGAGTAAAAAAETSTSWATGVVAQPSAESPQAVGETAVEGTALSMGDVKEALPEVGATARVDTAATDAAEEEVCAMYVVGCVVYFGRALPLVFLFLRV